MANNEVFDSSKYNFYKARMYTRNREDRINQPGTTPTKYKISFMDMLTLPQLHPAVDIPYSIAINICKEFIRKPVWVDHEEFFMGTIGYVAFANITEDRDQLYIGKKGDLNNTHNGEIISYKTMMGILGILKKCIKDLIQTKQVMSFNDLDISISYSMEWAFDEEDIVFTKKKEGEEENLDFEKSLIYATKFKAEEVSIVGRGQGACPGSSVLRTLAKKTLCPRLLQLFTKSKRCYGLKHSSLTNFKLNTIKSNINKFAICGNKIRIVNNGNSFSNSSYNELQEKLKSIKTISFLKKKREDRRMAETKGEGDVRMTDEATEDDVTMEEQSDSKKQPNQINQVNQSNDNNTEQIEDKQIQEALEFYNLTPEYLKTLGGMVLLKKRNKEKLEEKNSIENYPKNKKSFIELGAINPKDKLEFENSEELDNSLKSVFIKPENKQFSQLLQYILKTQTELKKKAEENLSLIQKKKTVNTDYLNNVDMSYNRKFSKSTPTNKQTKHQVLMRASRLLNNYKQSGTPEVMKQFKKFINKTDL